jgi:N-acetylglutamate synthase-like GNAT family acetyltransferase
MSQPGPQTAPEIRAAREADAGPACELVHRSIIELCKADHGGDRLTLEGWLCNKTPENMRHWIGRPGTTCLIAEIDGAMAGVGAVTDYGEVILAYVDPAFRFRGVTVALLTRMEEIAREKRADRMNVTTTDTAYRFFLERGYTPEEEEGDLFSEAQNSLIKEFPDEA